ncbi:MAG: response regulator [Marinoscillum sp.]
MVQGKPIRCIIVEDEVHHQELLLFYLKKISIVEVVGMYEDTVNATMQIEKKKPDLIFLDINISGLEGPEFMDLLEHQPKVIMISAHSEEFMKNHYDIPYLAYIQKPISLEKLQTALETLGQ